MSFKICSICLVHAWQIPSVPEYYVLVCFNTRGITPKRVTTGVAHFAFDVAKFCLESEKGKFQPITIHKSHVTPLLKAVIPLNFDKQFV